MNFSGWVKQASTDQSFPCVRHEIVRFGKKASRWSLPVVREPTAAENSASPAEQQLLRDRCDFVFMSLGKKKKKSLFSSARTADYFFLLWGPADESTVNYLVSDPLGGGTGGFLTGNQCQTKCGYARCTALHTSFSSSSFLALRFCTHWKTQTDLGGAPPRAGIVTPVASRPRRKEHCAPTMKGTAKN